MRRSTALRLVLWLAVLATMAPALWHLVRPLAWGAEPDPARLAKGVLASAPGLLLVFAVGRAVLAVLPAGVPGSHRPGGLPATWAASHLLGTLTLDLTGRLAAGGGAPAPGLVLGGTALLVLARWLTSPGAPVPGGPLPGGAPRLPGLLALALFASLLALPAVLWASPAVSARPDAASSPALELVASLTPARFAGEALPMAWVHALALFALLAHGLSGAVPSRAARWTALTTLAAAPAVVLAARRDPALSLLVLGAGAGAAFALQWLRRADRRCLWLAAIAWGSAALSGSGGAALALVGVATLVAFSRGARPGVLVAGGASLALFALPALLDGTLLDEGKNTMWDLVGGVRDAPHASLAAEIGTAARAAGDLSQWGLAWPAALLAVAAFGARRASRGRPERARGLAAPVGRELGALTAWTLSTLALHLALNAWAGTTSSWAPDADTGLALLVLSPAALLATGLAVLPREIPGGSRGAVPEA